MEPESGAALDHELIDASVNNSGEALKALAQLRESLQTLPFFGGAKVVWLQNCNFLGEERTASAAAVTEALAALAQELKSFRWDNVRLLVSAGKVDKRKSFYKALEKIGPVETFAGWSENEDRMARAAAALVRRALRETQQEISDEALAQLVAFVGPQPRLLSSEVEKLASLCRRADPASRPETSPPSSPATNRPAPLPWATPWASAIWPPSCAAWTRNCGKSGVTPNATKSACSMV